MVAPPVHVIHWRAGTFLAYIYLDCQGVFYEAAVAHSTARNTVSQIH